MNLKRIFLTTALVMALTSRLLASEVQIAHKAWLSWCLMTQTAFPGNEGNHINLRNEAAPGQIPFASCGMAYSYESCGPFALWHNHPDVPHALNPSTLRVYIQTPSGTIIRNPSAYEGTGITIHPLTHGWSGSVTYRLVHTSGEVLETRTASWNFSPPPCMSCVGNVCTVDKKIGSIDLGIPLGDVSFGVGSNRLSYRSENLGNPGRSAVKFEGHIISGISATTNTGSSLGTVQTGNTVATLIDSASTEDPNRFQILYAYIDDPRDNPPTPVYRTMTFEMAGGNFVFTDESEGVSQVTVYSKPDANTWTMTENGKRRTTRETTHNTTSLLVNVHTVEEKSDVDGSWQIVSKVEEHKGKFNWGWEVTKQIVDPGGLNLVSTFDYYDYDELNPSTLQVQRLGRIKSETLPTGFVRTYDYLPTDTYNSAYSTVDIIQEHFADTAGGKVTRIHYGTIAGVASVLHEEFVAGELVSKREVSGTTTLRTEKVYTSATAAPLVTEYRYPSASTSETLYPDGTAERVTSQVLGGILTKTTLRGVKNPGSGHYLIQGDETVQEIRRSGVEQKTIRRKIYNGTAFRLEEKVMAAEDHRERKTRMDVFYGNSAFKDHSEYYSYSCCGVASETGREGLTRRYFYDDLGRVRKTHYMGLANETLRHGLTVHSYRYPESLAVPNSDAAGDNKLGSITIDRAGEVILETSRSPRDGSLQSTVKTVEYEPSSGIGKRTTIYHPVTADDGSIVPLTVETKYTDAQAAAEGGNMQPNQVRSYGATSLGLVESVSSRKSDNTLFGTVHRQYDWAGRVIAVTYSGDQDGNTLPDQEIIQYDAAGLLKSSADADGVTKLYSYDLPNGFSIQAIDLNANGSIDLGTDIATRIKSGVTANANGSVGEWSTEEVWNGSWKLMSRHESRAGGVYRGSVVYRGGQAAVTSVERRYEPGAGNWAVVTRQPEGLSKIDRQVGGLSLATELIGEDGQAVYQIARGYDAWNRVSTETDSRKSAGTTYTYVAGLVETINSVTDSTGTVAFTYDERGRRKTVDAPDTVDNQNLTVTNVITNTYDIAGNVIEVNGAPGYRVACSYNALHQMETMTTFGMSTVITRWEYDLDRGWLTGKRYNSGGSGIGQGPLYSYTAAGRLNQRIWARGVSSSYSYDAGGLPVGIDYSDSTPDVAVLQRDGLGRVTSLIDGAGQSSIDYAETDLSMAVTWQSGTLLGNWTVRVENDFSGRISGLEADRGSSPAYAVEYSYDSKGRPLRVEDSQGSKAGYGYDGAGRLREVAIGSGGGDFLYGTRYLDAAGHLDRIIYHNGSFASGFAVFSDFDYGRNAAGQITSMEMRDGSSKTVGYHASGGVASLRQKHSSAGSALRKGTSGTYAYDGIGNRIFSARGGDDVGNNQAVIAYTSNALNQYTAIANPGVAGVSGVADPAAVVTVNGTNASRQGDRFYKEVAVDNSGGPVSLEVEVASGTESGSGRILIPPASQSMAYDADGNLLSDGVHQFTWDAENRLIMIEVTATAVIAGVSYSRVENLYDHASCRIRRAVYDSTSGPSVSDTRYLWAGWRCLVELAADSSVRRELVWGAGWNGIIDLSDGNGALLWIHDSSAGSHFCHYDGNGNITGLSDPSGQRTAEYTYDTFGVLTEIRGAYAAANPYRFSTKPFEEVGGLYYYGYRFYDPATGRWLSRDPIGERGGINNYSMVENDPVANIDFLGLKEIEVGRCEAYLFIGHSTKTNPIKWKMNGACSLGGAVTCYPDVNQPVDKYEDFRPDPDIDYSRPGYYDYIPNLQFPSDNLWPNVPTHSAQSTAGGLGKGTAVWNSAADAKARGFESGDPRSEHNHDKAIKNALDSIVLAVHKLCSKSCCNKVKVIVEVGDDQWTNSYIENAVKKTGAVLGGKFIDTDNDKWEEVFTCP